MAYNYNYLYIAVPTTAFNNGAYYIHSPNKTGFICTSGDSLGSTYSISTAEGPNKSFYVYKFSTSSYSDKFNLDSPNGSWLESFGTTSRSSYTSLQYSEYCVYKFCAIASSADNSSLNSAIRAQGDYQSPPVYCFYTTVVDSSYDGSWEKWVTSFTSGTDKLAKRHNSNTTGLVKDSSDIGIPSSNTYTRIIRLVSKTAYQTTVGVYKSNVVANLNDSSYYKGYNLTDGTYSNQDMRIPAGTSGEKYYALHSINGSSCNLYAGMSGQGSASADSYMYYGAWGNNAWASTGTTFLPVMQSDGTFSTTTYKWCAAYTTRSAYVWSYVQVSLSAGYNYTFKLHTYSQASSEGIILRPGTSSRPSTWSLAIGGTTSAYCTGADATQTYNLKVDSDSTMYIYFYTDSDSYIGPTTTTYDSSQNPIGTYDTDYSLGDVEVTRTPITSTVTLNKYGGTAGTSTVTATYGQPMPEIDIPHRTGVNGDYGFDGYWDAPTSGTQYYKADGTSARTWNKTNTSVTLFARWINLLICDAFVYNGTYASSGLLSKTDTSSSDNRLIIFTSDGAGISTVCGVATHSVYTKVSGTDSITLASGFRCTDGGTPAVSIWDGRYNSYAAFTVLSTGRGIVTNSHVVTASNNIILNPPITFGAAAPTSPGISFPRVVAFSTPGGSNYLGAVYSPDSGVTFGSSYAFTIPIAIYKQTVTAIAAAVSSNSINVNATTALTVTAFYTNGATKKVLTSNTINYDGGCEVEMTQNPTGVISLTGY